MLPALEPVKSLVRKRSRGRSRSPRDVLSAAKSLYHLASGFTPQPKRSRTLPPILNNGPESGSVVTRQNDFTRTKTLRKRKSRGQRRRIKYKKRRFRKYKRKIRKIAGPPKTMIKFYTTYGRSYASDPNVQVVVNIPIISFRGSGTASASTGSGAVSNGSVNLFPTNDVTTMYDYFNDQLFPTSTTTNATLKNFWWFTDKARVDISMTNVGFATVDNSANSAEYEIFMIWPRKLVTDENVSMVTMTDWIARANSYSETRIGGQNLFNGKALVNDPAWRMWTNAYVPSYFRTRSIGRGYLAVGETARFVKTIKVKGFMSNQKYLNISDTTSTMAWYKRFGCSIIVIFRGCINPGSVTGGYTRTRICFNVNKEIDTWTRGTTLQPGRMDTYLYPNSF